MQLTELIKTRQSVRKYSDKEIPPEVLRKILEAGHLAPSWMNVQSWKFIVVQNQETKDMLSKLACKQPHVRNCQTLIVCVADMNAWSKEEFTKLMRGKGVADAAIENIMSMPAYYPPVISEEMVKLRSVEQLTYAVSYMMLEAESYDVRSCIIGAIENELTGYDTDFSREVKTRLGLSDKDIIATMITLGYEEAPKPTVKSRKAFDEVVFLEKVGNNF